MSRLTKPSEGFFLAKRRTVSAIDYRMETLQKEQDAIDLGEETILRFREITAELKALEKIRDYVRNVLLWDTSEGL